MGPWAKNSGWAHLDDSWCHLESFRSAWGSPGGPSWAVLARLGAVLEASWAPKPPQHKSASRSARCGGPRSPSRPPPSYGVILRSQPKYNVPRAIKIAKALPVIRQPFRPVRSGTIPLQTSPFLKEYILRSQPQYNVPRREGSQRRFPSSASRPVPCGGPPSPSRPPPI